MKNNDKNTYNINISISEDKLYHSNLSQENLEYLLYFVCT